jgi:hypothetical protein
MTQGTQKPKPIKNTLRLNHPLVLDLLKVCSPIKFIPAKLPPSTKTRQAPKSQPFIGVQAVIHKGKSFMVLNVIPWGLQSTRRMASARRAISRWKVQEEFQAFVIAPRRSVRVPN